MPIVQVTQFGIALPKWIVDGKNSYVVLGLYVLIFMIVLPIVVVSDSRVCQRQLDAFFSQLHAN